MEIQVGELIKKAKVSRCGDGDYPVLSMTMHEGLMFQNDRFKKQIASVDQSNYQVVKRHQLVESFPIDEGVLAVQELTDEGIVSPAYKIWDVNMDKVIPLYLELALRSPRSIEYYKSKLRGTTARRRSITDAEFCAMQINCPELREQERIIELITRTKAISVKRQQELDTLDELIKARFVEMFDSGDYPQVAISELVSGKVPSVKKDFNPDDVIKYVDISSIDNKRNIMTGYTEYVLKEAPSRAQQHIVKGDIVISTVRPNLRNVAITEYGDNNLVASSGFCVLRASKCIPEYLLAIVCSDKFTDDMTKVVTGANYPAIKDSDVLNYIVSNPPMEAQRQFAEFVKQVDKSKVAVQKALNETQNLFDSLMQEYFG